MPRKPNRELTTSEREALNQYEKYIEKHGEPPSVRQLGALLDITHGPAHYLITKLREKGYLSARPVTLIRPTLTKKAKRTQ